MMRKLFLFIVAFMLLALLGQVAAEELEIGISLFPIGMIDGEEDRQVVDEGYELAEDQELNDEKDFMEEWLVGFHFRYSWGFLYTSLDAMVMPPGMIEDMTALPVLDDFGNPVIDERTGMPKKTPGVFRPGFYNFIDVGVKLDIGEIVVFAETGVNILYIHQQDNLNEEQKDAVGVNLRIGASYKVTSNMSVGLTGTAIFPDFETMGAALKGLAGESGYEDAGDNVQLLPMLSIVLYL